VMFITTANILDPIPPALRDRMETIRLPGYTAEEKLHIAKMHLIPKQLNEHGITKRQVNINTEALRDIIDKYTAEAGVRNLERNIAKVYRKAARMIVEEDLKKVPVNSDNLAEFLGARKYYKEVAGRKDDVGVATGMAWTSVGGVILFVEALKMPGTGQLILTGQLGDVMQESAKAAYSYVKSRAKRMGIDPEEFKKTDIHIHVPAGATPKDGPSAGVAMATAVASVFIGVPVDHTIAMTGEVTLRGKVMQIGGVKEKLLAAVRAGIDTVIFPEKNEVDVDEVEEEIRNQVRVEYVSVIDDVFNITLKKTKEQRKRKRAAAGARAEVGA